MSLLSTDPPRGDAWVPTRWSVLLTLDRETEPDWEASWAYLVEAYRSTMERYVRRVLSRVRGRPAAAEDCAEVVQGFLTACVEKAWLSRADPSRGRFRAFVKTLLCRYVYRLRKHETAKRRHPGPQQGIFSLLDDDEALDLNAEDHEDLRTFDRNWVEIATERALSRLGEEHDRYRVVIQDLIDTDGEGSGDIAERMGLRARQFPVLKHRARQRFARIFEEELRSTVGDPEAFADEWRALSPYFPGRSAG